MSKKDKEEKEDSVKWTFCGEEDEWDGFDRRITRWMRKKLGSVGESIWSGEIPEIEYLSDEGLQDHCDRVLDALRLNDNALARSCKKDKEFWTKEWQMQWLDRQVTLIMLTLITLKNTLKIKRSWKLLITVDQSLI